MALPTEFPKDAVRVILNLIGQTKPATIDLVDAVYTLVGYGLHVTFNQSATIQADDQETTQLKNELKAAVPQLHQQALLMGPILQALLLKALEAIIGRLLR